MKSKSQSDAKASTAITRRAPGERKGLRKSAAGKGGSLALRKTGANQKTSQPIDQLVAVLKKACEATGIRNEMVAERIIAQLTYAQRSLTVGKKNLNSDKEADKDLATAIWAIGEMARRM